MFNISNDDNSDNKTLVIAEAGINHNGNFEQAKKLIESAASSGADVVKFQIFNVDEFCSENSEFFDLFKSLELKDSEWIKLSDIAYKNQIIFTASVFGEKSADLLDKIDVAFYKVASGDITHIPMLDYISRKNRPIILSTGMSTIGDIEEAVNKIYQNGNKEIALMHCVSNYPTNYYDTNLQVIQTLKNIFKVPVGFSDHTIGPLLPALAVIAGADIIEKHFTTDKNLSGPDHKLSLDPDDFKEMVNNIRIAEKSRGNGIKSITKSENELKKLSRRSIFANENMARGTVLKKDKFKIVRPGTGIAPKYVEIIKGKILKEDVNENEPITWDKI